MSSFGQDFNNDSGAGFPDPFNDVASTFMPSSLENALRWCEFIMLQNGVYRAAIDRVVSYFITDVQIEGTDRESKDNYADFLNNTLGIHALLRVVALDYLCFHGDTRVPTRDGVYAIRDLEGKTVDILSEGGVYRPAEFKKFGRQSLLEVTFRDGRKVLATPEHQWIVRKSTGGTVRVPTTMLAGRWIERTVAARPAKNEDYNEGVRHGFVFGDGSLYNKYALNKTTMAVANFFGEKDEALLPFFTEYSAPRLQKRREGANVDCYKIHGLPAHYKTLPDNTASASYWYGFVVGFLAADGTVDTHGCAMLTQKSRATLEAIEAQLPRIGMVAGPIRSQTQTRLLPAYKGVSKEHTLTMHYMTLLKQFMSVDDLVIESHIKKFNDGISNSNYGKYVGVQSVTETGIVDDVYCCVEPETHSFVIDNGVLTGNCYGNFFCSVIIPFRRALSCPGCGFEAPLKQIHGNQKFGFSWTGYEFTASCPFCKYSGKWTHIDRRATEEDDIIVKRWNPHEIDLIWDPYTDQVSHIWKIPPHLKQYVAKGTLFHLERQPYEVLQAIKNNNHIQFAKDVMYHGKEQCLAGILNKGWGISRILTNFRQAWYLQVLHRYNEAIGLDYIIPFRVLTPVPRQGSGGEMGDPLFSTDMGGFTGQINSMLRKRRTDPTSWFSLPFPVQYQALGAEAANMAPHELMDQALDTLLTAVGVPVEFYKGSLTIQAAPAALRLMESNWSHLTRVLNNFLQWLVNKISIALNWDEVTATLERPQHADDLQRQLAKLQLMMGSQISQTTGLKSVGIEYEEEEKRKQEEQKFQAEEGQKLQEELQAGGLGEQMAAGQDPTQQGGAPGGDPSQSGGAAPAGGDPSQGGGAAPTGQPGAPVDPVQAVIANIPPAGQASFTPQELEQSAQTTATQIYALQPAQRQAALRALKTKNATIHSLVKSLLADMDTQAESKGRQMQASQAAQTQQQSMAPPPPQGAAGGMPQQQ